MYGGHRQVQAERVSTNRGKHQLQKRYTESALFLIKTKFYRKNFADLVRFTNLLIEKRY